MSSIFPKMDKNIFNISLIFFINNSSFISALFKNNKLLFNYYAQNIIRHFNPGPDNHSFVTKLCKYLPRNFFHSIHSYLRNVTRALHVQKHYLCEFAPKHEMFEIMDHRKLKIYLLLKTIKLQEYRDRNHNLWQIHQS